MEWPTWRDQLWEAHEARDTLHHGKRDKNELLSNVAVNLSARNRRQGELFATAREVGRTLNRTSVKTRQQYCQL